MTFYINEVHIKESERGYEYIGLFTNTNWVGEGHFSGWYGAEFYTDTTLIAYGIQSSQPLYNSKRPFDGGFKIVNKHYDKIGIGSCYWTEQFEADSVEEAIEIFKNQKWK